MTVSKDYLVINNLIGAMTRKYVCRGCNKGCKSAVTHGCQKTCSDCMSVSPCSYDYVRIPCDSCNRQFRSRAYFDKHKTNKLERNSVCDQTRNCAVCHRFITGKKHECFKPYCKNCDQIKEVGHFCYMMPLKNELPRSDEVLFVFFVFETTQDTKFSD